MMTLLILFLLGFGCSCVLGERNIQKLSLALLHTITYTMTITTPPCLIQDTFSILEHHSCTVLQCQMRIYIYFQ